MTMERLDPREGNYCFGCGASNVRGMRLGFVLDREQRRVTGHFRLGVEYQGATGMLHGGIIALLLDEAMGKLNRLHEAQAVTAELNVRYLRPVPTEAEITVEASEIGRTGRTLEHQGAIRDATGQVLAQARGRFVIIGPRGDASRVAPTQPR